MYLHLPSRKPLNFAEVERLKAMGAHGRPQLQAAGCGGDWIDRLTAQRNACIPGGATPMGCALGPQPQYGQPPMNNVPGTAPGANPNNWNPSSCAPGWRVTYVGNNGASTNAAASVTVTVTPFADFYGFRMIIMGASNWTVTSVTIAAVNYLGNAQATAGTAFADSEETTGRILLGLSNASLAVSVVLVNISAGALVPNVTFQGHMRALGT